MHHLVSVAAGRRSLFQQGDKGKVAPGAFIALTIGVEKFAVLQLPSGATGVCDNVK